MANMSKFKAETALDTGQFELTVAAIIYRNYIRGQLNKPREEPLTTESQPTRTPTTTGRKHVAGAKSAGSRKTTPQDPATPATQSATLPAADGTGKESLAFLRNQTVFEIMRTAVQKQPAWLLGFLHQMERSNSTLLLMISQNQQQFFSMLNEIGGESEGTECGTSEGRLSREGVIHVTQEENEVIDSSNQIQAELEQLKDQFRAELEQLKDQFRAEQEQHKDQLEQALEEMRTNTMRDFERMQLNEHQMREERRKNRSVKLEATVAHVKMREEEEGQLAQLQTYIQGITSSESGGLIQSLPGFVWEVAISLVGGLLFFGLRAAFGRIKF